MRTWLVVAALAVAVAVLAENPDMHRNVSQIIAARGFPVEDHLVSTADGWMLSMQRIPYGLSGPTGTRPPVLLVHGFMDSSVTWVINEVIPENLAFVLSEAGFDVWLGNNRGNSLSTINTKYPPTSNAYWDFSFDEMAKYDLPAMVEYVLAQNGASTTGYVGHSEGTTQAFASFSILPEVAAKINVAVMLAPVTKLGHTNSSGLRYLADLPVNDTVRILGEQVFLPDDVKIQDVLGILCTVQPAYCENGMTGLMGPFTADINQTRLGVILGHEPATSSVRNLLHWLQSVVTNTYQMYDYGTAGNLAHYNQSAPPTYDVSSIKVPPIVLIRGGHDDLGDPIDDAWLDDQLGSTVVYTTTIEKWSHMSPVWGVDACELVYPTLVSMFQKYQDA